MFKNKAQNSKEKRGKQITSEISLHINGFRSCDYVDWKYKELLFGAKINRLC